MADSTIPEKQNPVLDDAVNETVKENPAARFDLNTLVTNASKKFIQKKLDDFPRICHIFRVQNKLKLDELREAGNEKGFSEKKDFKWEYEIPSELYYFMVNLVYRDFWKDDNAKIWRPFLRALLRGYDPMETLMKVKSLYGSTKSAEKAGIV